MINFEALDKVIAVVVVILMLSLFVQSLQALLKKLFKIKSLQIETSLVHLFQYALDGKSMDIIKSKLNNAPFLRMIMPRSKHPSETTGNAKVQALYCAVEEEFRKVGRVTASGKMMLDSISKEDLLKFVGRIQNNELVQKLAPGLPKELDAIQQKLVVFDSSVATIKTQYASVYNAAKAQLDQIELLIAPLVADARKIFTGEAVTANMLLADIGKLGELKAGQVTAVQDQVKQAIAQLQTVPDAAPAIKVLEGLNEALGSLTLITNGIGSIKNSLDRLSTWYDTVMQSFEERYTRGMKTWAWVISALVVIFLNADLVHIYHEVSTNDAKREAILRAAEKMKTPDGTATFQDPESAQAWVKNAKEVIDKGVKDYTGMGFDGPVWMSKTWDWVRNDQSDDKWSTGIKKALRTVFGWFVMTLLLSAGAPFWEDTLESLFGIKNLVRGKSGTKNVEQKSGEGQPKP